MEVDKHDDHACPSVATTSAHHGGNVSSAAVAAFFGRRNTRNYTYTSNANTCIVLFFVLVFLLSIPFWVIGYLLSIGLLPGLHQLSLFLHRYYLHRHSYSNNNAHQVSKYLRRSFDFRRTTNYWWYIPMVGLMPVIFFDE
jgi:hypothetical protein